MTGVEVSLDNNSQVLYSKTTLEETVHDDEIDDYDDIIIEDKETGRMNKNTSLSKKEENEQVKDSASEVTISVFSKIGAVIKYIKYTASSLLLLLCVVLVMACILQNETKASSQYNIPSYVSIAILWFLLSWLGLLEGGQGALVGLQPVPKLKYAQTHKHSYHNTTLVHTGDDTLERFIVGRQFLVVIVVFLISICVSPSSNDANPLSLPSFLNTVLLEYGIAPMITTIVIGHLACQVTAAICMLDFINNRVMSWTIHLSLYIEKIGILHAVYVVQIIFSKIAGNRTVAESNKDISSPCTSLAKSMFFWGRVILSTAILIYSLAITIEAILQGKSGMYDGVSIPLSIILFISFLCLVGMMDGMQIAAFALLNMPKQELEQYGVANAMCELIFRSDERLQAFLIGRQIFVACLMFIVARIASVDVSSEEQNLLGVSDGMQEFINTGLLGAIVLTILGSLVWRVVASTFPLAFMSNPVIYIILQICFFLEATGICSSTWLLAKLHQWMTKMLPDSTYLDKELDEHEINDLIVEDGDAR